MRMFYAYRSPNGWAPARSWLSLLRAGASRGNFAVGRSARDRFQRFESGARREFRRCEGRLSLKGDSRAVVAGGGEGLATGRAGKIASRVAALPGAVAGEDNVIYPRAAGRANDFSAANSCIAIRVMPNG
jgi:hypothetical protein